MANHLKIKDTTFNVGDMINVYVKVKEGDKTRLQLFTGLLIATKGREENKSFTVRKIASHGIGVERIFPVNSPEIDKVTLKSAGAARRSKLYYLRERTGRLALRVKSPTAIKVTDETAPKLAGTKGRKPSRKAAAK